MENAEKKKSGLATAGMVVGIVGICTSFIPIVNNASFVLGILAAVFGIIGLIKKMPLGKTLSALILGVLAIVITLACQISVSKAIDDAVDEMNEAVNGLSDDLSAMAGEKTDDILENNLDVAFGDFVVIEGDFLDDTELKVILTNKGSETASFTVKIEATNSDGSRITTDNIYADSLKANQSQEFKAFTLVESDKYEALKNATFKVLEVSMY